MGMQAPGKDCLAETGLHHLQGHATGIDDHIVEAELRRWGSTGNQAVESARRMMEMCPRLEAELQHNNAHGIRQRMAQLAYLVQTDRLSRSACLNLLMSQPQCLVDFAVQQIWEEQDLVAVCKPFNRLLYPKKR